MSRGVEGDPGGGGGVCLGIGPFIGWSGPGYGCSARGDTRSLAGFLVKTVKRDTPVAAVGLFAFSVHCRKPSEAIHTTSGVLARRTKENRLL